MPAGVRSWPSPAISSRFDRLERELRMAGEERRDLRLAFLRLERAGAVDEQPAGLHQRGGAVEHLRLQRRERGDVLRLLQPGDVGMAADGAGRRAGRVEEHGVECLCRAPIRACRLRRAAPRDRGGEVLGEPLQAVLRDVDGGHAWRRRRRAAAVLPPGAAQRSATRLSGDVAEELCRAARRRRPAPTRRPRRSRASPATRCASGEADRAGRKQRAAEPLGPYGGIALHRQVEARLLKMRRGDFFSGRFAVGRGSSARRASPACCSRAASGRARISSRSRASRRSTPLTSPRARPVRRSLAGLRDGEVDGGVVGHVEEEDLRRGDVQDARRARRNSSGSGRSSARGERRLDLAAAAERHADDGADQRAVALVEREEMRVAVRLVEERVERHAVLDHLAQDRRRGAADGEAGRRWLSAPAARLSAPDAASASAPRAAPARPARDHGRGEPCGDWTGAAAVGSALRGERRRDCAISCSAAMRFSVAGWVEKRLSMRSPVSGLMMKSGAVAGLRSARHHRHAAGGALRSCRAPRRATADCRRSPRRRGRRNIRACG